MLELLDLLDDDDVEHTVEVAGLDPIGWQQLVEAHPPLRGSHDQWHPVTFPPALIAACCTELLEADTRADVDLDTAATWWDDWPVDAAEEVYAACLRLSAPTSIEWAMRHLDHDDRLRLEVAYCAPRALEHDRFLTWSQRSRDLALAHLVRTADVCPGCGIATKDMTDPAAGDVKILGCVHCETRHVVQATIPPDEAHRMHVVVVPIPPADRET